METVRSTDFYTVHAWMRTELGLDLTSRNIFAYVYGWTIQEREYFCSKAETAEYFGLSERTVATIFSDLTQRGLLLRRTERMPAGNLRVFYVVAPEVTAKFAGARMQKLQGVYAKFAVTHLQNLQKSIYNNYNEYSEEYSNKDKVVETADAVPTAHADASAPAPVVSPVPVEASTEVPAHEPSLFRDELEPETPVTKKQNAGTAPRKEKSSGKKEKKGAGTVDFFARMMVEFNDLSEKTARRFVKFRDKKGAEKTEHAWNLLVIGARKAQAMGYTAEQFFHFMAYHRWYGCNDAYVFERLQKAQPEELQDMSVEEAVAAFQNARSTVTPRPAIPHPGYSRPAPAAPSKFEQNMNAMEDALEFLSKRV